VFGLPTKAITLFFFMESFLIIALSF